MHTCTHTHSGAGRDTYAMTGQSNLCRGMESELVCTHTYPHTFPWIPRDGTGQKRNPGHVSHTAFSYPVAPTHSAHHTHTRHTLHIPYTPMSSCVIHIVFPRHTSALKLPQYSLHCFEHTFILGVLCAAGSHLHKQAQTFTVKMVFKDLNTHSNYNYINTH